MIRVGLFVLLSFSATSWVVAEKVVLGSLPHGNLPTDYSMYVSIENTGANGYQPLRLEFRPTKPSFLRDYRVSVRIEPTRQYGAKLQCAVEKAITLPEGAKVHTVDLLVPCYYPWHSLKVSLFEEGELLKNGITRYPLQLMHRNAAQRATVGLLVGKTPSQANARFFPDVRTINTVFGEGPLPEDTKLIRQPPRTALAMYQRVQPCWIQYRAFDVDGAGDQWLWYSQLDMVIASGAQLSLMSSTAPDKYEALEKWVASGGTLIIYGDLTLVDALASQKISWIEINPMAFLGEADVPGQLKVNAQNDGAELYEDEFSVLKMNQGRGFPTRGSLYKIMKREGHPFADLESEKDISDRLQLGSLGLGNVLTIDDPDPFPGSFQFWFSINTILKGRSLDADPLSWSQRYGIDCSLGNDNYWSWLLGSVGGPPVKVFLLLNLLFAILIGPICYFFLRKRGRLYLLYFAAPFAALVVTISLVLYALAADGFGTRVRVRQITWLDQNSGYQVKQSRQTLYSTLGGASQIELRPDVAIYPISSRPLGNDYGNRTDQNRRGGVRLQDSRTIYSGGFLPPRQQVQYMQAAVKKSKVQVFDFDFQEETPSVTHGFSSPCHLVLTRDQKGQLWRAVDVEPGTPTPLEKLSLQESKNLIDNSYLPVLGDVPDLKQDNWYRYRMAVSRQNRRTAPPVEFSLLERRFRNWGRSLPKNAFLALTEVDVNATGVSEAKVDQSVHVLMGMTQ